MDEIKRLIKFLVTLAAVLGAVITLMLSLPLTDVWVGQIVGLLGVGIAVVTAFIKFLQDLDKIESGTVG